MPISAFTEWRVRVNGDDNNGGAFDPTIIGAETDYSAQDTAQLSLSDLSTSGASATVNSAAGGFTAAMVGNSLRIISGTSFTAGTYMILSVTNTNTAVLDRNCSTATASGGVGRVGGALATIQRTQQVGAVAGNAIWIRGSGSGNPLDIDYFLSGQTNILAGLNLYGHNGRPKVSHPGIGLFSGQGVVRDFFFVQTASSQTIHGAVSGGFAVFNSVFDSGGNDSTQASNASLTECLIMNSGNQTPGVRPAVQHAQNVSATVTRTHIKDQRGAGANIRADFGVGFYGCIIQNCAGDGLQISGTSSSRTIYRDNTIHGNGGHGIRLASASVGLCDNLITGHTTPGTHAIFYDVAAASRQEIDRVFGNNLHGNTSDSNVTLNTSNTAIDPLYANAPLDLTPTNLALRRLAGVGVQM